ncbi:hypothetical protein ACQ86N_26640 [Puia sp. P3]|uniref:hypothetical protein n=1 Tax=Puia sp. P3 TaxID=3423952 RepID=UPI003D677757
MVRYIRGISVVRCLRVRHSSTGATATDPRYWIRRYALPPTYEINYNSVNTLALNPHATDVNIWSMPVWWDCATDDEYNGYLKK